LPGYQGQAHRGYRSHMPIRKVKSWLRRGSRRNAEQRRFEAALGRLAKHEVTDTVAEAELNAWMALLEGGGAQPEPNGGKREPGAR